MGHLTLTWISVKTSCGNLDDLSNIGNHLCSQNPGHKDLSTKELVQKFVCSFESWEFRMSLKFQGATQPRITDLLTDPLQVSS